MQLNGLLVPALHFNISHLQLLLSRRVGSSFPSRWQVGWRLVYSSSEAWVLHSTAGQGFVVLDCLRCLYRILMPFQFELNDVPPITTEFQLWCLDPSVRGLSEHD